MKVLVISHNCFSTYNNMGKTFISLFSRFDKGELCQLYIYPSFPDVDTCDNYYRITDKDVLKSIFRVKKYGSQVPKEKISAEVSERYENIKDEKLYKRKGNADSFIRICRDLLWKIGVWDTPSLNAWIEQQKPTCIFLSPGYAKFIYDIALKIGRKYRLPIVTYICDDYYFVKESQKFIDKIQLDLLRRKTDEILFNTKHLVTISEEIKNDYLSKFKVPSTVIMTGAEENNVACARNERNILTYMGNVRCNRYISLREIGGLLDDINSEKGTDYQLHIYSPEKDEEILTVLKSAQSIKFKGFISGGDFKKAFSESELLLHTEAFDEESRDLVKHSVSTKIADSLASGIPLVAYGPEGISSIQHLIRNNCAYVAVSKEELKDVLLKAFKGENSEIIVENALKTAEKYHDSEKNSKKLREIFESLERERETVYT